MKTILKIVVGIVIAAIVLVVGLIALIGGAANEVQKESDQHSITKAQYESVKKGTSLKDVKAKLGEPSDKQNTQVEGLGEQDCIYYNKEGEIASMYQFCFDNKRLASKSSY
jgi:uncharacterized protein YxeA